MSNNLYVISYDDSTRTWQCSCGAKSERNGHNRFLARHPKLCSERRALAHVLAQGTRCVDEEAGRKGEGKAGRVGLV